MKISETGVSEDRITALERKVRDMEALVNGLINELLDFKAVAVTMIREKEERSRQELTRGPAGQENVSPAPENPSASPSAEATAESSTVIRPKGRSEADVPAEPRMVRIMQSDGTMKMESRFGDRNMTDSSKGSGRTRKGGSVSRK